MIKYYPNKEINKRKWDECVSSSVNGRIYAYSWYLDCVADQWDALIFGNYHAVFPLPYRIKWGIKYVYQPVFTQQLGLFSKIKITPSLLENFIQNIPAHFKYVNLNLNQHNRLYTRLFRVESKQNIEMDLLADYSILRDKYSTNLKRNLKKATDAKLTIFENLKPDAIIRLFHENQADQFGNISPSDYTRLLRLVYKALQLGHAEVWGAYTSENNLCCGAIFLRSHKRLTFLFSGTDKDARKNAALPFVLNAFIEANANKELVFDFEGSNYSSLARFYLGFGGQTISYSQIHILQSAAILRPILKSYLFFRAKRRLV